MLTVENLLHTETHAKANLYRKADIKSDTIETVLEQACSILA